LHGGALIVNPHAIDSVADALYSAVTMPPEERRSRMRRLRRQVASRDVFWWVNTSCALPSPRIYPTFRSRMTMCRRMRRGIRRFEQ
jgi:hypothetical protein